MVSNGQGVSSPGFWEGLSGQNPAGLINNQRVKIQLGAATFDNSTANARGSAALLAGNGSVAGGIEYSKYNSAPYPQGSAQINGGLALHASSVHTTFGFSGHQYQPNGGSSFDAGILTEIAPMIRFGAIVPDFTHGLHIVAGGFTFNLDPAVDLVVDAAYHLNARNGTVKPGMTLHTDLVQATAAYGIKFTGTSDVFLSSKFTGALGLKVSDNFLVEYEYRALPEHRLGLTLRLN